MKYLIGVLASIVLLCATPHAQAYPDKPMTFIVPWAAGGSTDVISRLIASSLGNVLGQQVIVQNVPGASGTVGAVQAAQAAPDGYTFYYGTNSTYGIAPNLYNNLPYDFQKSFQPISFIGTMPMVMCITPSLEPKSIEEFIDLAKKKPGDLTFASAGLGATSHLSAELLQDIAGIQMVHVPYPGGGPAVQAVIAGEVDLIFNDVATAKRFADTGTIRCLGVTGAERFPGLPDLPIFEESGVSGLEVATQNGLFAPAGVPDEVVATMNKALTTVLNEPELQKKLLNLGVLAQPTTPEELERIVREEGAKWGELIQKRHIKLQ